MNALKAYDNAAVDVCHVALVEDFFLRAQAYEGTCGHCGGRLALVLCWDNAELAVCKSCGEEQQA